MKVIVKRESKAQDVALRLCSISEGAKFTARRAVNQGESGVS